MDTQNLPLASWWIAALCVAELHAQGAPGAETAAVSTRAVLEGVVYDVLNAPAEGAVVASGAGGRAVTDASGSYRLAVERPAGGRPARITASGARGCARATVSLGLAAGTTRLDPLALSGASCEPGWVPTFGTELDGTVSELVVHDDGGGAALYAGGGFTTTGAVAASRVARWDGTTWSALGSGLDGAVNALAVHDDGAGPALYAGGAFDLTAGGPPDGIARWDGAAWAAVGSGAFTVDSLGVYDDGGGPALYAGGHFASGDLDTVARWDGSSWVALPDAPRVVSDPLVFPAQIFAFAVYDDGSGPALFAGGTMTHAGAGTANRIAKWDGTSWTPLGSGLSGGAFGGWVTSLVVHDDGGGPELYVGGEFTHAGGVPASRVARWDGSTWSAVGAGTNNIVHALASHDDGGATSLYAGGLFTLAGGASASRIARWDDSTWSALDSGANGSVGALARFDDGGGPALFAGGSFTSVPDSGDAYLAKWGHPAEDLVPPVLSCPPEVVVLEVFGSAPGEVVSFDVTASDCRDPAPGVVCAPPSGSSFPRGTTWVTCTATDASGNQATCQFPVTVRLKARKHAAPQWGGQVSR
jgi:hypothetical protein